MLGALFIIYPLKICSIKYCAIANEEVRPGESASIWNAFLC